MADTSTEKYNSQLSPPDCVKGMTRLDKSKFEKSVRVPFIVANKKRMEMVLKVLKPYFLLLPKFDCITDENEESKCIVLNPNLLSCFKDLSEAERKELNVYGITDLNFKEICLKFGNFDRDDIFKAILPSGTSVSSHSIVGHIVQLNLRDDLIPFKSIIGEVYLETSSPKIKRIISKVQIIESEFRNFKMEVLAERDNAKDLGTLVEVRESNCIFKFDFANVYWNPRLSTERARILAKIGKRDVLYDVFAGVGPFAIPVAKKTKCKVVANDLNPECTKWLRENIKINKCGSNIEVFNLDGRKFIQTVIKEHLIKEWKSLIEMREYSRIPTYHITMNLPAIAVQFLDAFRGILEVDCVQLPEELLMEQLLPHIHVYCFAKYEENVLNTVKTMVEDVLHVKLDEVEIVEVRNVAPYKFMFRISFVMPESVLFASSSVNMAKTKSKQKQNVFVVKKGTSNTKVIKNSRKRKTIKDVDLLNEKMKCVQDELRKASVQKRNLSEKKISKHNKSDRNVNIEETISGLQSL